MDISIIIDMLTPCLTERKTGTVFNTEVVKIKLKKSDYKKWNFDWSIPQKNGFDIHALKILEDNDIQGLIATKVNINSKAVYIDIVEAAPDNIGRFGKYKGVGAHLFAFACKRAKDVGYNCIYFNAKTNLIEHYKNKLGAVQIGNSQRMIIEEESFENLFNKYYGGN